MDWYFLDDERFPPATDGTRRWTTFRTGEEIISAIAETGLPDGISFDNDLGTDLMEGCEVAKTILEMIVDGSLTYPQNFEYTIHSENPIGKERINGYMNDITRFVAMKTKYPIGC